MFQWLKNHFIPHEGNNHRPEILHKKNIHLIIGVVMFVEIFAFLIPTIALIGNADSAILPAVLSQLTNQQRVSMNLPALAVSPLLNEAAQEKANDMAANGYFAHVSPDGKTPWYWLDQVGYNYSYAGENLAVNFTDSQDVTTAWMNSPEHRANILKANYTEVGTGVAEGMYQGNETIFVAQDFGTPTAMTVLAEDTPTTPPVVSSQPTVATAAPAPEKILGAETSPKPIPVAVTQAPAKPIVTVPTQTTPMPKAAVLPVVSAPVVHTQVTPVAQPTFWQRLATSPRNTTNVILFVIFAIVVLAVFLNVGIKVSHQHPDLVLNGFMVIAIIGTAFVMNNYISKSNTTVVQSVDYTSSHTIL